MGASAQIQRVIDEAAASDALVVLDNLGQLQRDKQQEEILMLIYQSLHAAEGEMLVCHEQSALGVEFDLPDLNSRMRGFAHFALVPLRDQGKAEVLTQRAHTKGYDLPDAVLEYWLRRGPRDLSTLVRDLERLDQATLTHQRLLTVPLLKQYWDTDMAVRGNKIRVVLGLLPWSAAAVPDMWCRHYRLLMNCWPGNGQCIYWYP